MEQRRPSKARVDALTRAFAIYREASKPAAAVPYKKQRALYDRYRKALDAVLSDLGAQSLSAENERGLDAAATRWWDAQAKRGPGKHW